MRRRAIGVALALVLVGLGALASGASAAVPVRAFGMLPSTTQAGGHPDLQIAFSLLDARKQQSEGVNTPCDCENARFITVHAPRGLVGDPHAAPRCSAANFTTGTCPVDSQVGVVEPTLAGLPVVVPVFNLVPRAGEAGLLAFAVFNSQIYESFSSRTGSDYGLDTKIAVADLLPLDAVNQILWGVPADSSHDRLRGIGVLVTKLCDDNDVAILPNSENDTAPLSGPAFAVKRCGQGGTPMPSNSPPHPFMENPTSCGEARESSIDVFGYDGSENRATAPFPEVTGCDVLSFNPSLAARSSSKATDSPSGLDVELTLPQYESPTVPSPSEIHGSEMVLPEGFSINANAADGKSSCADTEASFGTLDEARCPDISKIGTLRLETALLPGPLPGYIYLGKPLPGNRYRIFLTADGFNVHVKLAGRIVPDPTTGQLRVIFDDLPETPFQKFSLHIFGSERGVLATPTKCGTYGIVTTFTPWDTVLGEQTSKTFFEVDEGPNGSPCPGASRPFNPGFEAASTGNSAGSHSPFALRLSREDGDQFLSALSVKTPPGFAATLKGIPYCPEAAIATLATSAYTGIAEQLSPSCPAASQIGEVVGGVGAGSRPFYAPGKVYLAGPYKGAPLSLVVVVPAVSGPYDLGNIAVRSALYVDPVTTQVSVISDPLPQIVGGVPLRVRSVFVSLSRPNFTLNPTNCDPHAVETEISGDEGASASPSADFQVANCANLPFAPKLSLRLIGGTKRRGHPALRAALKMSEGNANLSRLVVALPGTELLDQGHIGTVCTRVQFAADQCPAGSVYGHASATTPLLDQPLSGPVFLRSSSNKLPDLVVALKGPSSQPIEVVLAGQVDTGPSGGIRTSFEAVPDAQVSSFTLSMQGRSKGLLENSVDICKEPQSANVKATGQNGRHSTQRPMLQTACKGKADRTLKERGGLARAARAVR
jgi:hypothetical protein